MSLVTKVVMDKDDLQPLADAVKIIGELDSSKKINLEDMIDIVSTAAENGTSGSITLPELSSPASASDVLAGKEFIDGSGNKVTGTITTVAAKTVTPGTSDQTAVSSGVYTTGAVKVRGDSNLLAENIKSGVSIFDVNGSYTGSDNGTTDPVLQEKVVRPGASGSVVRPDSGYDGLSAVYITGDADLVASNIKSGVNIFGITGTYTGGGAGSGLYSAAQLIEWTPTSDTTTMEVSHTLGVVPDGYRVLATGVYDDYRPSGSEKYVLNLEADITFAYVSSYLVSTGAALASSGVEGILYIITDFSGDNTAQSIKSSLGSWTFKGGQTYEILVYKR